MRKKSEILIDQQRPEMMHQILTGFWGFFFYSYWEKVFFFSRKWGGKQMEMFGQKAIIKKFMVKEGVSQLVRIYIFDYILINIFVR